MSEAHRIELLVRRDGPKEAKAWVERTLKLYREAIAAGGFAATKEYRPLFEQSIDDFESWLKDQQLP